MAIEPEASRSKSKQAQCAGTRKDGTRCTARVMGAGSSCYAHDNARAAERDAARRKGGARRATAARAEKLVPALLRPVLDTLLAALAGVEAGTTSPQQASAFSSLAGAIVKVYQVGTLEERLQALEAARAAQGGDEA